MITSTQISNNEILTFIALLAVTYWAVKLSLQTEKTIETVKK